MDIALFSPSSLFAQDDDSSTDEENAEAQQKFVERNHQFPGMELLIREFTFHQLNANLLWPGSFAFAEWLVQHKSWIEGKRIIELGSMMNCIKESMYSSERSFVVSEQSKRGSHDSCGTGGLAIFLWKWFQIDITTSDYDDSDIEENIAHNCKVNGVIPVLPHIKHSWGDAFPTAYPDWDLVIASDILLYVKQYNNLIRTLSFLLKTHMPNSDEPIQKKSDKENGKYPGASRPSFLMSWRRRIGKEEESNFFNGCENAGLEVQHLGSRVYCIKPRETDANKTD